MGGRQVRRGPPASHKGVDEEPDRIRTPERFSEVGVETLLSTIVRARGDLRVSARLARAGAAIVVRRKVAYTMCTRRPPALIQP